MQDTAIKPATATATAAYQATASTDRRPVQVRTALDVLDACDNIAAHPDGTPRGPRADIWIRGVASPVLDLQAGGQDAARQGVHTDLEIHGRNPGRGVLVGRYDTATPDQAKKAATHAARRIARIFGLPWT